MQEKLYAYNKDYLEHLGKSQKHTTKNNMEKLDQVELSQKDKTDSLFTILFINFVETLCNVILSFVLEIVL